MRCTYFVCLFTSKPKLTREFAESANSVWTALDNLLTNQIPGSVLVSTCNSNGVETPVV